MTMHDNLHVLLRHAWVFSVDPRRDLFLRTCFVRTELCGFAAEEWDCPQQSVYHVHQNVHHVLQWPATILTTLICQCHVQATYIGEGALQ